MCVCMCVCVCVCVSSDGHLYPGKPEKSVLEASKQEAPTTQPQPEAEGLEAPWVVTAVSRH
jgi:hypothetical protein